MRSSIVVAFLAIYVQGVTADGNDWVNPSFVVQKSGAPDAQKKIVSYAKSSANNGPWTVFGDSSILPPNGDKLDYLSWAPYHWPDCGWCTGPRTHLTTGGNRTNSDGDSDPDTGSNNNGTDSSGDAADYGDDDTDGGDDDDGSGSSLVPVPIPAVPSLPAAHRKMIRRVRRFAHVPFEARTVFVAQADEIELDSPNKDIPDASSITLPVSLPTVIPGSESSSTSDNVMSGSAAAAENARKTQKAQPQTTNAPKGKSTQGAAATKTAGGGSNCTPSPSKSLPPSATWTTCKYVTRDGQLNPDVRLLNGVNAIVATTQSIFYNAAAAILAGSQDYEQPAAQFIQVFFLDPHSGMHPRVEYGQVIRGPGEQVGQYLGVIDLRSMVKVVNAIQLMRAMSAPAWTSNLDAQMLAWSTQYVKWLKTSAVGQSALSAPNNHGSFATNQLTAMSILIKDLNSAEAALKAYFSTQFLDQIAASGEQPFEAVRTRPFHYRCFNLEAMITNAKLGDQLGLNFWTAKSKYGATIKDALDFVLKKGPGKEDVSDIFPHVAAIAAAYGDDGTYMAYLRKMDKDFMAAPYYYYNQPGALTQAPSANPKAKGKGKNVDGESSAQHRLGDADESLAPTPTTTDLPLATPTIPWECPDAFATATLVQLDDGVYVTCDELKHLYGYGTVTNNS